MITYKWVLNTFLTSVTVFGFTISSTFAMESDGDKQNVSRRTSFRFNDLQSCLSAFDKVDQNTVPTLISSASKGDVRSVQRLSELQSALDSLSGLGYRSRGSGKDKAIEGVKESFRINHSQIMNLLNPDSSTSFRVYKDLNSCLQAFRGVNRGTLPNLLKNAQLDQGAAQELSKFKTALDELNKLGYCPRGSDTDTAIAGVQEFFKIHRSQIENILNSPLKVTLGQIYPSQTADERKIIFDQNQVVSSNGYIVNGVVHRLDKPTSKMYGYMDERYQSKTNLKIPKYATTILNVVDSDTVDYTLFLKQRKSNPLNPLALDMANASLPGGLAYNGKGNAQEEIIEYRTNLHTPLSEAKLNAEESQQLGRIKNFLPREGGLYMNNVSVFRNGSKNGYTFMNKPEKIAVGAIAAYRHESRRPSGKEVDSDFYKDIASPAEYWASTERKLEAFCDMALENGHDSLVLSAFGCGAFGNPPDKMAQSFKNVIWKYKGCFREIHFAIYAGGNPNDINLLTFSNLFHNKVMQ